MEKQFTLLAHTGFLVYIGIYIGSLDGYTIVIIEDDFTCTLLNAVLSTFYRRKKYSNLQCCHIVS